MVQFRKENKRGEHLYNRIKTVFIEAVDPKALLLRIDFRGFNDERLHQYIEKHAREDGAVELLLTVKRQFPNDWFQKLTTALRHDNIGLSHTAEEMEKIRNRLSSETAEMRNSGERVSTTENPYSEVLPLLPTAPPGQEHETANV
ncbi:uncharacterized protein LOC124264746 [Haliotis rubra]|uniref:uncharacterized protein LOC124264746 n=1 Tax=Haliotis rubra TaxID=36100 RepID=UPI001EE62AEF|nr:uncharacterized protein LOC124264746 [Haliotis rubra]XP_046555475.1 uncharacterized protein LOC124264746 [Haliotis rubra]